MFVDTLFTLGIEAPEKRHMLAPGVFWGNIVLLPQ
jgi:hypothetical protein